VSPVIFFKRALISGQIPGKNGEIGRVGTKKIVPPRPTWLSLFSPFFLPLSLDLNKNQPLSK
jgi:hypothetical protein